ncbi:MAG TPA: mechanosensitive ion channel family protein [Candidatus Acidoferrum sp.]
MSLVLLLSLGGVSVGSFQQRGAAGAEEDDKSQSSGAPVEIDGRPILQVYAPLGGISPEERAANIERRILRFARKRTAEVDLIRVEDRGAWVEVLAGNEPLMAVTQGDATAVGRSPAQLAAEYAEIIRRSVSTYRQEHTLSALLRGLLFSLIATIGLFLVFFVLLRARRVARNYFQRFVDRSKENSSTQPARSRMVGYLVAPLIGTGIIVVTAAAVALLEIYATLVLSFFPSTRYISAKLSRWTISELGYVFEIVWSYLPNLVIVVVFFVAARALIRVNKYIFQEIREGTLRVKGFYPDWAQPTAKLVRLLILAITVVVIFPYLPGSSSPAFRGVSVFLGVLLSLGSTSAVAHGVAGTILTYMRSYSIGDFVRIGETVGRVVEKTLLVTRIETQKREIVTIPNGSVLGGVVVNYSAEAGMGGVIFYTKVSIGYSAPWRTVHQLLISAAQATPDILQKPAPFVLQANLNDFYVAYELNAFTGRPQNMQFIYSALHQNIQDRFNEAGIEINSPHYVSLRDGNRTAIPEQFLPNGYQTPSRPVL